MIPQLIPPTTVPIDQLLEFYDRFGEETFARGKKRDNWVIPACRHPECPDFEVRSFTSVQAKEWVGHCSTRFTTESFMEVTVIHYQDFPVWMCRKDGSIPQPEYRTDEVVCDIRRCLHEAWSNRPVGSFRPIGRSFKERNSSGLRYISSLIGNVKAFTGNELIRLSSGKVLFQIAFKGNLLVEQ